MLVRYTPFFWKDLFSINHIIEQDGPQSLQASAIK